MIKSINSSFNSITGTERITFRPPGISEKTSFRSTYFTDRTESYLINEKKLTGKLKSGKLFNKLKFPIGFSFWGFSIKLARVKLQHNSSNPTVRFKKKKSKRLRQVPTELKSQNTAGFSRRKKGILSFIGWPVKTIKKDRASYYGDPDAKIKYYKLYWQMIHIIESQSLYLDPEIKQKDIIKYLGSNRNYTYKALNLYGDTNFKGLLNRYRINHFKLILENEIKAGRKCVLSEYYSQCGFGTNESFYRTFRRLEGITPGEYLKKITVN